MAGESASRDGICDLSIAASILYLNIAIAGKEPGKPAGFVGVGVSFYQPGGFVNG